MTHTDPIADMLTRIRNAFMMEKPEVSIPLSKIKVEILKILKKEGYLSDFKVLKNEFPPRIEVSLKYREDDKKKCVIEGIQRISKPGRRVFADVDGIPQVLGGLGVAIISTSRGLMTGKDCRRNNIGGEVLLHVW